MSGGRQGGQWESGEPGDATATRPPLRILILEDEAADVELTQRLLTRAGLDITAVAVDTKASYIEQLAAFRPEVILADYSLPGFSGERALDIAQRQCPQVPVIFLSGVLGDEAAVELLRHGATDYVLKDRPARLPAVIVRAVAEAEQRAQQARVEAQLGRSQRLAVIGRLAGGVAHEFNNQVGAMLHYAAFIREEAAERAARADGEGWDDVRRDAEQIERAGNRVIRLVRQLLAAGSQETVHSELIDLNKIVAGIEELLRSTIGDRIDFRLSLAPRLWPVTADPAQIEQVLLNLAINASDAMSDGGTFSIGTRNVTVGRSEAGQHAGLAPGAHVCLSVGDTGVGMEPEILEHAFEPFFTTKPFVAGGGLGLASVYGIITQAGGTVDIASAPGSGTTVTAWLPATVGAVAVLWEATG